jgi:transcriptional regulator with XRE-family HTH domain
MELSDLIGLSEDQISNIERGRSWVGEMTLALLANALKVPQASLFDYSGNEEFLKGGGLKLRAPRKAPTLLVRRKRSVDIQIPEVKR